MSGGCGKGIATGGGGGGGGGIPSLVPSSNSLVNSDSDSVGTGLSSVTTQHSHGTSSSNIKGPVGISSKPALPP